MLLFCYYASYAESLLASSHTPKDFWVTCRIKTLAIAVAPCNSSLIQMTPTLKLVWLVPVRTGNLDTLIQTQNKTKNRRKQIGYRDRPTPFHQEKGMMKALGGGRGKTGICQDQEKARLVSPWRGLSSGPGQPRYDQQHLFFSFPLGERMFTTPLAAAPRRGLELRRWAQHFAGQSATWERRAGDRSVGHLIVDCAGHFAGHFAGQ